MFVTVLSFPVNHEHHFMYLWCRKRLVSSGTSKITEALFCPFSPPLPRSQDVLNAPCYLFRVGHPEGHNIPTCTAQNILHQPSHLASRYSGHITGRCLPCPPINTALRRFQKLLSSGLWRRVVYQRDHST